MSRRPDRRAGQPRLPSRVAAAALALAASVAPASAQPPIDLPGASAFPAGISSTLDGTLFVGSLAEGGVLRVKPGAAPETWLKPGASGTRSIFGVTVDTFRNWLWVCSNDASALGVAGPGEVKGSYLMAFDRGSAKQIISARLPGAHALCHSIALGGDGKAYVTDSLAPRVLRFEPESKRFEVYASDPRFAPPSAGAIGLGGIAFGQNGDLYVDTVAKPALFHIATDLHGAGTITQIKPSRPLVLPGALHALLLGGFLLVEGGGRLDRVSINKDAAAIEVLKEGLAGPSAVTVVDTTAFVSEGQLSHLGGKGGPPRQPFRICSVPLLTFSSH